MVISSPPRTVDPLQMADWIHCNLCFVRPGKGTPFHITSCGHIYCDKCILRESKNNCKMCGSKYSSMELSGNMKPDVEMYFQDPFEQFNKAFKKLMQTWDFQRNHRRRFFTHLLSKVSEQNKMLVEARKMVSSAQALEKEAMKLKEENIYLKKLVQEKGIGSSSRPCSRSGCSPTLHRNSKSSPSVSPGMRHVSYSGSRQKSSMTIHHSLGGNVGTASSSQITSQLSQMTHTSITPDRIIAMTPPSGGRMGTVGYGSPADQMISLRHTPQSMPHPIYTPSFHGTPDTMAG